MSDLVREPVAEHEPMSTGLIEESPRRRLEQGRRPFGARVRGFTVVPGEGDAAATALPAPAAPVDQDHYVAELELRLRELVEIERVRDLEIHGLEADVEAQQERITELETALFHAERRGDDLDRRWNDLAQVYEDTATALVQAGAQLEAIHRQASYRLILAMSRAIRRRPGIYDLLQRLTGRIVGDVRR